MKILVTGAGGFIGSHVVEACVKAGHRVRALVHYNARNDWGHLTKVAADVLASVEVKLGDVTDPFLVQDLVDGCDVVLHLAALIGIPYSYVAPASYVAVNVTGTLNVLQASRRAGAKRIVITSTSEVYGTALYTPIDEQHPLQGQSPYSASKIAADKLAEAYFRSFDLPVVTLRPFNTYGPRQSARAVIPTILVQALRGASTIELGNLSTRRDMTFVTDTAEAFVLAATLPGVEGQTIHFGQGSAVSISELAAMCLQSVGSSAEIVSIPDRRRPARSEVELLVCDAGKARKALGWTPKISLAEGLTLTARYLETHCADYRATGYVV